MKKIPFLDIADINCWIVYNMPLSSQQRGDYELVDSIQQICIKDKFFGMGWDVEIPGFDSNTYMTDENVAKYIEEYHRVNGSVSEQAINYYKSVKKGDYVICRNKNGHYYVGKVSSEGSYYLFDKSNDILKYFSWGCSVEKWVEFATERDVPAEISGRFSQRFHTTIQRIDGYRQRLLVIAMYGDKDIPKLAISEYNFVRSMNYMELEDLVSVFIAKRHKDYYLMPSSCKVSQQNVEFYFACGGKKLITCQVKNQKDIVIDHYIKEEYFERVYIFSGLWDKEKVAELRKDYKSYSHIYIISPDELYEILKEEAIFCNPYYEYEKEGISPRDICMDGYIEKVCPKGINEYSIDDDFICFMRKDGLFYSKEFSSLVLKFHIFEDRNAERNYIDRIIKDINR